MASPLHSERKGFLPSVTQQANPGVTEADFEVMGANAKKEASQFTNPRLATLEQVNPKAAGRLSKKERLIGTAREMMSYRALIDRTVDVFGDEIKASRWLSLPNRDFDGQTPLQVAQKNGYDLQAIEPILIRIEHGVYY
jgi:uncharacterized protein (DUF2384 family)